MKIKWRLLGVLTAAVTLIAFSAISAYANAPNGTDLAQGATVGLTDNGPNNGAFTANLDTGVSFATPATTGGAPAGAELATAVTTIGNSANYVPALAFVANNNGSSATQNVGNTAAITAKEVNDLILPATTVNVVSMVNKNATPANNTNAPLCGAELATAVPAWNIVSNTG